MTSFLTARLHADLETPVSAYLKLCKGHSHSFLFESVEGSQVWARYSILGYGARRLITARGAELTVTAAGETHHHRGPDPLSALQSLVRAQPLPKPQPGLPRFVGGLFGFVSYDAVRWFEPVGEQSPNPSVPELVFVEPELVAVFDNRTHSLDLYSLDGAALETARERLSGPVPPQRPGGTWSEPRPLDDRDSFMAAVARAKEHIHAGDIIQVVLSRRFEMAAVASPLSVYRGLRTINPSPYLFYLQTPEVTLAGASPEVMLRVEDGTAVVRPIAGTRPRGGDAAEDRRLEEELLADPKERAEHIMLVDLGRNDVGRVSRPGSVQVAELMRVEHYSHVMHIVSEVTGRLRDDHDAYDALRAAFPAGTLSGAPKVRAMQIIETLEQRRRGIYGGAVGYFGPNGDADFGIAIRTLECYRDRLVVQAGAGIVADSDAAKEADETEHKARAVLRAARWATELRS